MNKIDEAAQLIRVKNLHGAGEIAAALAEDGKLVTDEIQAVLDEAERMAAWWTHDGHSVVAGRLHSNQLAAAVDAYLASRRP